MRIAQVYNTQAAKRAVNLTMNGDPVEKAQAKGLNLSGLAEKAVAAELLRNARDQ
jgi:post-segregation antitoxin (ccd killing protein)